MPPGEKAAGSRPSRVNRRGKPPGPLDWEGSGGILPPFPLDPLLHFGQQRRVSLPDAEMAFGKAGLGRIGQDVFPGFPSVFGTADHAIPVVLHPNGARAAECFVQPFGGLALPRMHDVFQLVVGRQLKQNVHVGGHDSEGIQAESGSVEMEQGVEHDLRKMRIPQQAGSPAGIQPIVEAVGKQAVVFGFEGLGPRFRVACPPGFLFEGELAEGLGGKGIAEVKGHELEPLFLLPMGKTVAVLDDLASRIEEG